MSLNQRNDTTVNRDINLILVANNSELYPDSFYHRNSSLGNLESRRSSAHNNLFPTFHQENRFKEEPVKREERMTDAQRYAHQCLQYQKYLFDDKIRLIIHRMAILAYHNFKEKNQHVFLTFFIQRFICTLAKKLLLNRFQLLFLQYVFQESRWRYNMEIIASCADQFKSFIHLPQSQTPHSQVKSLQVYLLFCAYYSKKSLNEIANEGIYNYFLKTIHQRFKQRYQDWITISGVTKIVINPKILNAIFRKLTSFNQKEDQYVNNYNLLVEQILQISPAYNAENKERKMRKKPQEVQNQLPHIQPIGMPLEDSNDYPSLGLRRNQTSFIENLNGTDPADYVERCKRN